MLSFANATAIELQYRGRVWHQSNARLACRRFWSPTKASASTSRETGEPRRHFCAFPILADTDASLLRGRRLDADDPDKLSVSDPVRDLLRWLNGPELFEAGAQGGRWHSFRNLCKSEFTDGSHPPPPGVAAGILL